MTISGPAMGRVKTCGEEDATLRTQAMGFETDAQRDLGRRRSSIVVSVDRLMGRQSCTDGEGKFFV